MRLSRGGVIMDVVDWLRSLGLERYEAAFRDNEVDERVLPSLTQEDLKEIGVGPGPPPNAPRSNRCAARPYRRKRALC
jgi:hypothetical protein